MHCTVFLNRSWWCTIPTRYLLCSFIQITNHEQIVKSNTVDCSSVLESNPCSNSHKKMPDDTDHLIIIIICFCVTFHTYKHSLCGVAIKRIRLWVQAMEMTFLCRVPGLPLCDTVGSWTIWMNLIVNWKKTHGMAQVLLKRPYHMLVWEHLESVGEDKEVWIDHTRKSRRKI